MGLESIDLIEVADFPTIKKHDLICAMVTGRAGRNRQWTQSQGEP